MRDLCLPWFLPQAGGGGVGGGGGGGGGGGALEGSFSVGEPQRPLNRDPV